MTKPNSGPGPDRPEPWVEAHFLPGAKLLLSVFIPAFLLLMPILFVPVEKPITMIRVSKYTDDQRITSLLMRPQVSVGTEVAPPETLSGINLTGYDKFAGKNLQNTVFEDAMLAGVDFDQTDLRYADLRNADLREANLTRTNLAHARLNGAHLAGAIFEPQSVEGIEGIPSISGLDSLVFRTDPSGMSQFRSLCQVAGYRQQERQITYSLKSVENEQLRLQCAPQESGACFEYLFNLIFFDLTCQYGMSPGRPLVAIFGLWYVFAVIFDMLLLLPIKSDLIIIRKSLLAGVGTDQLESVRDTPSASLLLRVWRAHRTSLFYSLMSTFNIGFRDINFGKWLRLLTHDDLDIKAKGWIRTVSGVQALLSVYLVALWLLTYFGRPFS